MGAGLLLFLPAWHTGAGRGLLSGLLLFLPVGAARAALRLLHAALRLLHPSALVGSYLLPTDDIVNIAAGSDHIFLPPRVLLPDPRSVLVYAAPLWGTPNLLGFVQSREKRNQFKRKKKTTAPVLGKGVSKKS